MHKIGIIGYGNMGSWHAENIRKRVDGLDVAAVFDIKEERLKLAEENGFTIYNTVEEFLATDIDIVLVATPNNFHKYYSIMAMRAGKNVVSEKPVCMNIEELEDVIAVSKETGKKFTVHQNRRWDIDYAIMKNIMDNKIVGEPYLLDSRLYSSRGISGDWRSAKIAGGGVLYDWGVHLIDQVVMLANSKPVSVYSSLKHIRFTDVDDTFKLVINFESGLTAQITVDLWCYIDEPRWHLSGNDGTAAINKWFGREGKITKANIKEIEVHEGCVYTPNGLSKTMWPRPVSELENVELPLPEKDPRWEEFYENFMDAIDGKAEQIVTHDQMRTVMKILDAGYKSEQTNQVEFIK
jgi:predicted dehydrogenase